MYPKVNILYPKSIQMYPKTDTFYIKKNGGEYAVYNRLF